MFDIADFEFIHLSTVDSTNVYAKSLVLNGKDSNFIIVADTQTQGKTTKSNSFWESPAGNLYFTMAVKIDKHFQKFSHLFSFLTALSLVESVKNLSSNANIKIKWPNDVLFNVKKLSGILIEKEKDFIIIGVGVNIAHFPKDINIKYPTTSLLNEGINIDKDKFAQIFAEQIIKNLNWCIKTEFSGLINRIKNYMYKIGEEIFITFNNENFVGIFENIDSNGGIVLKTDNGIKTMLSGELTKENFI
ncbi:MAG: biotin--[acetyl-CoA-carboxylase] ligase [Alphaproteobacteria bacterium]